MNKEFYLSFFLRAVLAVLLYFVSFFYLFLPLASWLNMPIWVPYVFAGVCVVACYVSFPFLIEKTFNIDWLGENDIPEELKVFLNEVAAVNHVPVAKIGLLDTGLPNIYSYGHTPGNAKILVTSGMMNNLGMEELKAVFASEMGNIKSRSFMVLGMALCLPLLCAKGIDALVGSRRTIGNIAMLPIALLYVIMHIGMFFAYPFSRYRDYYSDAFVCFVMDDVNVPIQSLLKIIAHASSQVMTDDFEHISLISAIKPLGCLDLSFAGHLVLKSVDEAGDDVEQIAELIKKDMRRPRLVTELLGYSHRHPFLKIMYMEDTGMSMGLLSNFDFRGMKMVSEGTGFEYFLYEYLNIMGALAGAVLGGVLGHYYDSTIIGLFNGLLFFTCVYAVKLYISYPVTGFEQTSIANVEEQARNQIFTLMPVKISGGIFLQYLPGKIFSSSAVLVDESGVAVLDFQKPLGFFEIFFRLMHSHGFNENAACVTGWYRHFDVSTLEVYQIQFEDGKVITSPVYKGKIIFVGILFAVCLLLFLISML